MNSFFEDEDGNEIEATTEFIGGGFQQLIPAETRLKCEVISASWEEATSFRPMIVKVVLIVTEKGKHEGCTVADNIKVFDENPKKQAKAKTKLLTYDKLGGGLLSKAKKDIVGDNLLLDKSLAGLEILATFDVWEIEDFKNIDEKTGQPKVRTGNWVSKIEQSKGDKAIMEKAKTLDDDFDVPF